MTIPVRRVLGLVLLAMLLGWVGSISAVYLYGMREEARPADAIVVLGAAQYNGRPSPVLKARLDHAITLYKQGIAPRLILTGGVGAGDTVSEAEVGRRYAVAQGVPTSAILTERSGLRSIQSMEAVATFLQRRGFDSAVLVSDPFHMLRLRLLAFRLGLEAYSSPTRTSPISRDPEVEWRHAVRESLILPFTIFLGEA